MPNYLNGDITNGGWYVEGASGKIEDDKSNFDNLSTKASIQNDMKGLQRVESFNFGGFGSRPMALHTEYATDVSTGPAYGSQDIVFYLQRADIGEGEETESEFSKDDSTGNLAGIGVGGATGPVGDNGQIPSGANQIAVGGGLGGAVGGGSDGGAMAPVGGMTITDEEEIGTFSQNASRYVDVTAAAANAVRYVESLGSDYERLSLSASERLFSHVLSKGFIPESDLTGNRSEEEILQTLDRPSFAELAFQLARATGGRCRAKDIVKAINDGRIGLVNDKAKAYQQRSGMRKGSNK